MANVASTSNYWISQTALQFTLNALGDPDYLIATATAGAVIVVHVAGVSGLGYDDAHNYKRWTLAVNQVYFTTKTQKYVYARIPRTTEYGETALLVYPSKRLDLYGGYITTDGEPIIDDETQKQERAEDEEHYYYIELGLLSASVDDDGNAQERTWVNQFQFGILNTDEAIAGGLGGWADMIQLNQVNNTMSLLKDVAKMVVNSAGGYVEFAVGSILRLFGTDIKNIAIKTTSPDNNSDDTLPTTGWVSTQFLGKLRSLFIRKDQDDTTEHKLTMGAAEVTNDTKLKKDLQVGGTSRFGETTDDPLAGKGTLITNDGRIQTTNMQVRGTLSVLDMVASQIHSLDGYYYFSDTMKIAEVHENTNGTYTVVFEKEYDGDYLKFYVHDILLSIKADLSLAASTERTQTEGGNALKDISSTSWSRVVATSEEQVEDYITAAGTYIPEEGALWAIVQLYNATGNSAPKAGAYIARRGNNEVIEDETSDAYKKAQARKAAWCISVEDGRITYYMNQTSNVTGDENIGLALGKLPDIAPIRAIGAVGDIGLYAQTILAERLMQVKWRGNVKYIVIDEGEWNETRAEAGEYVFKTQTDDSGTTFYVQSQVTKDGYVYGCLTNGTTEEPSATAIDWEMISGSRIVDSVKTLYTITDTATLDEEGVGGLTGGDIEWVEDQSSLLTDDGEGYYYSEYYPYMWSKTVTTYTDGTSEETEAAHIIGVYGETGDAVSIEMNTQYDVIEVDSDMKSTNEAEDIRTVEVRLRQGAPLPIVLDSCEVLTELDSADIQTEMAVDSSDATLFKLFLKLQPGMDFSTDEKREIKCRVAATDTKGNTITRVCQHNVVYQKKPDNPTVYSLETNVDSVYINYADGRAMFSVPRIITKWSALKDGEDISESLLDTSVLFKYSIDGASAVQQSATYLATAIPSKHLKVWLEDVATGAVLASKTIPVIQVGKSVMMCDMADEFTVVGVDSDAILQTDEDIVITTDISAYYGGSETQINASSSGLTSAPPDNIEVTTAASGKKLAVTIKLKNGLSFVDNDQYVLYFTVVAANETRYVTHTIRGDRAAQDGITFKLLPNINQVHVDGDTGTPTEKTITAQCFKQVGTTREEVTDNVGESGTEGTIYYRIDGEETDHLFTGSIATTAFNTSLELIWKKNGLVLDQENVTRVQDGKTGGDAVRFNFDPATIFVPFEDGAVTGGFVQVNLSTIVGSQVLSSGYGIITAVDVQMFGHYKWLAVHGFDASQPNTNIYVQFVNGAEVSARDYGIIKCTILYNFVFSTASIYVYPYANGTDAIGLDGLAVVPTPATVSIPVKNNLISKAGSVDIELIGMKGDTEVTPIPSGATIDVVGTNPGITCEYTDDAVTVEWTAGGSVPDSMEATVLISLEVEDKYYSRAIKVPVTFAREGNDSVTYAMTATDVIHRSTVNGEAVYDPTSITLGIVRDKGGKAENLTAATLATYGAVTWDFYKSDGTTQTAIGGLTKSIASMTDLSKVTITFVSTEGGTYTKTILVVDDGEQGITGKQGFIGCSARVFVDSLVDGQTYRCDSDGVTHADGFWQDYLVVNSSDYESGYIVFRCKKTFTFDNGGDDVDLTDTANYPTAADTTNYPTAADIKEYVLGLKDSQGNAFWEETAVNYSSAFFTHLIAKNAYIKMLSGSGFYILGADGKVVGYFGNGDYHSGSGGETAETAKFWVDQNGNAYLCGKIDATSGTIGGFTIGTNSISGGLNKSLILGDDSMKVEFKAQSGTKTMTVSAGINSYAEGSYTFKFKQNRTTTIPNKTSKSYDWLNLNVVDLVKMDYFSSISATQKDNLHHYGFQWAMLGSGHIVMDGIVEGCCLDVINNFTASDQIQMLQMPLNSNRICVVSSYDNCILVLPDSTSLLNTKGLGVAFDAQTARSQYKAVAFKMDFYNLGAKTVYLVGWSAYNFGTSSHPNYTLEKSVFPYTYKGGKVKNRESLRDIPIASCCHLSLTLILNGSSGNTYHAIID